MGLGFVAIFGFTPPRCRCCCVREERPIEMEGVTLEELRRRMAEFARERDWDQFHSPRNLLLALVGEVGELSEIFQWRGEVPRGLPGWDKDDKEHLGEELSDVLLYLIRLSDICGIDMGKAVLRKLELNAVKYPANHCKGSSRKHAHRNATASDACIDGTADDGSKKKSKICIGGTEEVAP